MKNADKPISPVRGGLNVLLQPDSDADYLKECKPLIGLTKREYFTAMAMQGLIAADGAICADHETQMWPPAQIAEKAVQYADALLAELEKSEQ